MTTGQVIDVQSFGFTSTLARILDVTSVNSGSITTGRVLDVTSVNLATGTTGRVLDVTAVNTGTAVAAITGPVTADALDVVVLDASASVGTITSITQTAGSPTVTLSGSGAGRTFTAPAILSATATALTFTVTVTGGGTATWTVNVYPHGEWEVSPDASTWLPRFRRGRNPADVLPVGAVAGWGAQVAAIDFTTPVSLGGFVPDSTGALSSLQGGTPGFIAYADALTVTPRGFAPSGEWRDPAATMSVNTDGNLDIWLHQADIVVPTPPPPVPPAPPMPTASFTSSVTGQKWTWIYGEDFLTDIPLGGFTTRTTGADLGLLDPTSLGGSVYGASWKAKQAESLDTSGFGRYSAAKTMSVQDSVLRIWDHKEGAQAYGSAFKPLIPGADPNFLPYCRVEFRMRSTGNTGIGFGVVALLINNGHWPIWGEDDWPEAQLGGLVGGNRHFAQATNAFTHINGGGRSMTDWHRYVVEWFPQGTGGRVRYNVDDVNLFDSTDRVAVAPAVLGWLIQTASNGAGAVPDGVEGTLEIDWASIWLWTA